MFRKLFYLTSCIVLLCAASSIQAAVLEITPDAPEPGPTDIANLVGAVSDIDNVGTGSPGVYDNDGTTYVAHDRGGQGQTFVTGDGAGYLITGVWLQHVGYTTEADTTWYSMQAGSQLQIRVTDPAASGKDAFVLSSEIYDVTGEEENALPAAVTNDATGTSLWFHVILDAPVALAANTEYGFDLTSISGLGPVTFFETLGIRDDADGGNPYPDGSAYVTGAGGVADNVLTPAPGDRKFVVELEALDMAIGFGTPVIDGEVDDIWADAATAEFVPLEDPADGSGTWKVLYDAENLYVIVDVTDDSLQNDSAGSWQDDSVEIYFDGGNTKLSTALSGDDHQYTFGWTTEEIQGTNITGYTDGIEHAQVDTATGWRIEVKMPWMSIWGVVPQAGDLIGIDCYYNDDDDGGDSREGKMLGFSAIEGWNDASQWGTAVLAAKVKPKPKIVFVSFHGADDAPHADAVSEGFAEAPDKGYTDLLAGAGYAVTRYITTGTPDPDVLNAADLVIISRSINSGDYSNDGATAWNSITAPMIIMSGYTLRSSRMGYTTGTSMPDTVGDIKLTVNDPTHPIFDGIALTDGTMANLYAGVVVYPTDGVTVARGISINTDPIDDEGTILATVSAEGLDPSDSTIGGMVIGEWPAGAELTHAGGAGTDVLAGHRLVFLSGSRETDGVQSETAGIIDLYPDGEQMFLNAVDYMIPVKPIDPGTENLVHSWTFDDGTANDTVGNANGTLVGDAAVVDGQLVLDGNGDWMDMPGESIAMNTFEGLTIEVQFTSVAGGNTGFHMVTAFGEEGTGANPGYGYKYVCITPARGDNVSRAMIQTVSMDGDPWNEETGVSDVVEHDDGLPHHMVCTVDDTELAFYVDGVLIGTAALDPPGNSIAGIGTAVARIGKGVYGVDPLWAGSVDYLNLYNRALSEGEVLYLAGGRVPVDPGTDGLVAHYAFENDTTDSSGNGLDGTAIGDPTFAAGVEGMALDLNGDDYVDCGGAAEFSFTDAMTVSTWVNVRSHTAAWMAMVAKGENAWRLGFNNTTTGVHYAFSGSGRGWQQANTATELAFDEWYHVAATYDTNVGAQVYIDGVVDATNPDLGGIDTNAFSLLIGENPEATGRLFDGMLDELMIYNRALSEEEVLFLAGK